MFQFIWKDLFHHKSQTLFSLLGLAVVVFAYLLLVALAETMNDLLVKSGESGNLVIVQSDIVLPDESNISAEALNAVQALVPNLVSRVSPIIFRNIRVDDRLVQLRGVPLADWEQAFRLKLSEGAWPSAPDEIVIGEGAKLANGWGLGTSLRIYGRDFKVTGIFQSPGVVFASVWMPLEVAQDLFSPRRSSQMLMLQVAPGSDAEAVRTRLEQDPRLAGQYAIFYEDSIAKRNMSLMRDVTRLMWIVATLALFSVIFGTYNLTSLSLEERRHEAGILRALGFSPTTIRVFLSLRALLLGLLAYILALLAAWAYALLQKSFAPIYVLGFPFLFRLSTANLLTSLAWMLVLPALGAWLTPGRLLKDQVVFSLQRDTC